MPKDRWPALGVHGLEADLGEAILAAPLPEPARVWVTIESQYKRDDRILKFPVPRLRLFRDPDPGRFAL